MRAAESNLEKAKRRDAIDDQEAAIAALEKAKAELERILRQLREEEVERMLAMLEGRFRKMLKMQKKVYDATVVLDQTPPSDRNRAYEIEASRLSGNEAKIIALIDTVMVLFREDATAVALPEAALQIREDMEIVMVRLDGGKTGKLTQQIEEDILDALEDVIAALKKAQREQQARRASPPGAGGQPTDPPLVDNLAELKMIRALQIRVNRRTAIYQEMLERDGESFEKLLSQLHRLAERQERIEIISRDIVQGKNR